LDESESSFCRLKFNDYREYFYAWKGGPRPTGQFGSPEFIAEMLP
jgi:hypothetical protein